MGITKVGTTVPTVAGAAAATVQPPWAADMPRTAGGLLIARITAGAAANPITCGDGTWTSLGDVFSSLHNMRCSIWYKVAAGGDAAPTWASTATTDMIGCLEEFTGNSSSPYQAGSVGSAQGGTNVSQTVTAAAPASLAGGLAVTCIASHGADPETETPGSGWISSGWISSTGGADHSGGDYFLNPSTSVAPSELITWNQTQTDTAIQIAIFLPASGGGPGSLLKARQALWVS